MTTEVAVSVILPVRNGEKYFAECLRSLQEQTFKNFEVVIVNDGSTDSTAEIAASVGDSRFRVVQNPNPGLVGALNFGAQLSRADFIARFDADDVARRDRFAVQTDYLARHPGVGIVCSNAIVIDGAGNSVGRQLDSWRSESAVERGLQLQRRMKPIIHPTVMMRRSVFTELGGYRDYPAAEDRDLWLRAATITRLWRLPQCLVKYRMHSEGVSRLAARTQEVSSICAAIGAMVQRRRGVDIYVEYPQFAVAVRETVERQVGDLLDLRAAQQHLRDQLSSRGMAAGVQTGVNELLIRRRLVDPDASRRQAARMVREGAARVGGWLDRRQ